MARFFNTAGPCDPSRHYMLPPEERLPDIRGLIDRELYFVLHAPRQSGKTTLIRSLAQSLTSQGHYMAIYASCETGQPAGDDLERGIRAVLEAIAAQTERLSPELRPEALDAFDGIGAENRLVRYLSRWSERSARPVVLFLDEIDALRDSTLLSVLRQLRSGYPERPSHSPSTVALVGLRDVRDYRIQTRDESGNLGLAPPFNIKARTLILSNFTHDEINELYGQHTVETGQRFAPEAVELAWRLTRGQPWLVNALAAEIVDKLVRDRSVTVESAHIERAKEILIERRDAHFDLLVDRVHEPRMWRVIEPILRGGLLPPDLPEDDLDFVKDLGLVVLGSRGLEISNPIYEEIISGALVAAR